MPDEPQNPISEEISSSTATQDPIPDAPVPPMVSEPVAMPPEAPESPREAVDAVLVNNDTIQLTL